MNISLSEPAGVLVKTTLVDFPGIVACSFFLPGCNLRCPYCYNTELAEGQLPEDSSTVSLEQLFNHLEKRKNVLEGITISGGEALLSSKLKTIIKKAKSLGYKVKLDTNGTLPERLKEIIGSRDTVPDFIAMDIKTSGEKYPELLPSSGNINPFSKILESIEILKSFSNEKEFRTVMVPPLISKNEIKSIAKILPSDSSWKFAQFRNDNCLNKSFCSIIPYSDKEVSELVLYAKTFIPGAELR